MPFPHKNIRLTAEQYKGKLWHFVTICTERRRPIFSSGREAESLIAVLRIEAALTRFVIHAYCIMPDHFHILVLGADASSDLLVLIKKLKQRTAYDFKQRSGMVLWQKKFYDHILRPRDSVDAVAAYIWMNPVRKGLCGDPKSYPHSGSFALDWASLKLSEDDWVPSWKKDTQEQEPKENR